MRTLEEKKAFITTLATEVASSPEMETLFREAANRLDRMANQKSYEENIRIKEQQRKDEYNRRFG